MLFQGGCKICLFRQRVDQGGLAYTAGADDGDKFAHAMILLLFVVGSLEDATQEYPEIVFSP
jgi:hypothetical protein